MDDLRPAKRFRRRLACEPCRRKKSKCQGEKPACSFCVRLGQSCNYAEDTALPNLGNNASTADSISLPDREKGHRTEERLKFLETKLAEVVRAVGSQTPLSDQDIYENSLSASPQATSSEELGPNFSSSVLPAWDVVRSVTKLYLQFCDCQPLPLFDADELANSLESRDQETLFAILALALRFSKDAILQDNVVEFTEGYAESARKLVIKRVIQGPVELSTLQALCLLSCVDFTNGHKHRSSIYYSLAANLAQCAGLTTESPSSFPGPILEERRRCFWSIFMLKRLHGEDVSVVDFPGEDNYPLYPKTIGFIPGNNEAGSSSANSVNPTPNTTPKDTGVVSYALQLSELWGKTTKYARRREAPSKIPPWSSLSEYAAIMTQQMDCDTRIPCIYRLKPSGFANKSPTELNSSRNYWGPWLFIQFLYHTNLCLLNHPLILDLRLRNFEKKMPEIFVQHTSELITAHASRIVYLIDTVKEKSFKVSDPFLGHCSAIVATIFLQESISEDENVRKEKQGAFEKCFEFVQSFEDEWPHMARLADKLQLLKNTVSSSYQTPANSQTPDRGLLIDRARFWDVLDYSSSSELPETTGLFFGASIFSGS